MRAPTPRAPASSARSRAASALLSAALIASAAPAHASEGALDAGDRVPLAFVLNSPTGAQSRTRTSELLRLIDEEIRRSTGMSLLTIEDSVTKGCKGRLVCIILRVRTDYERDSLREPSGRYRPYADHLAILKERGTLYPKQMLFVTNIAREGEPDRLSAQLVDTDKALETYHNAIRTGDDWEANVEATVNEAALTTPRMEVMDIDGAEQFVSELFASHLRGPLEDAGMWKPFGQIELTLTQGALGISLDGISIGVSQAGGTTRIDGVRPGQRKISIEGADFLPYESVVEVRKGELATLEPELVPRATGNTQVAQNLTLVAGGVAVVAGAIVTILAVTTPVAGATGVCFRGVQTECETGSQLVQSGYDAERLGDQNSGGFLMAPLGYSLIATGATWSLGTWLFTEEGEIPWIALAAGAGVGLLSYGLSAAINPTLVSP